MTIIANNYTATPPATGQPTPLSPPAQGSAASGVSFGDVLDAINPLQHIPVVSSLYRAVTGSQISAGAQVVGDTIYGAALGGISALTSFASSVADVAVKQTTGENIGQHVVATLGAAGNTVTPSAASNAPTYTPLVANTTAPLPPPASTLPPDITTLSGQLTNATQAIYHTNGARPDFTSNRYQRVQAHDAINKQLLKMTI